MKRLLIFILLGSIFFTGCDIFSKWFKKSIEGIEADGIIIIYPTEEFVLNLSTVPDKGTIPDWRFEYPEQIELTETLVDSVTKKRRYTITAKEVGDYSLMISEKESKLTKTIIVKCRYKLTDFSLPAVKIVRLDQEFDFSKDFIFEPSEMITYDFEYIFDSNLIKYQEKTKLFQANADDKGDLPILVKDKKSGISKTIKIKVVDKFKIFDQFPVDIGIRKVLPSELIDYVEENSLKVKTEGEGLTLTSDLKVIANKEGSWDLLLYELVNGKSVEWGKINVICLSWLSVDFYYHQRIKKQKKSTMIENGMEEDLKQAKNFSFNYYWEGTNVKILNKTESEEFQKKLLNQSGLDPLHVGNHTDTCCFNGWAIKKIKNCDQNGSSNRYETVVEVSRSGLSYNEIVADTALHKELYEKKYETKFNITEEYLKNFKKVVSCHTYQGKEDPAINADTNGSGYGHLYYVYPYEKESQYHLLKEKMDDYIVFAKVSAKKYFDLNLASSESWEKEGGRNEKTNGELKIRKNQNNQTYNLYIGEPEQIAVPLESYSTSSGGFSSIVNTYGSVRVFKKDTVETIPSYPIVNKITIEWKSDDVTYESILWQLSSNFQEAFNIATSEEISNKRITLTFSEKTLGNDHSILNGIICFVRFKDKEGAILSKEIKVTKEN